MNGHVDSHQLSFRIQSILSFSQQAGDDTILRADASLAIYHMTTPDETWQIGSVLD
jgi:hypothetical protein